MSSTTTSVRTMVDKIFVRSVAVQEQRSGDVPIEIRRIRMRETLGNVAGERLSGITVETLQSVPVVER